MEQFSFCNGSKQIDSKIYEKKIRNILCIMQVSRLLKKPIGKYFTTDKNKC